MRKTIPLFAAMALTGWTSAHGENLIQIYELALDSDPQLRVARATLHSTREVRPQAKAQLLPTLSASGSASRTHSDRKSTSTLSGGDSTYNSSALSLTLTQPIYHHDYWIELEQADNQLAGAEADYAASEQDLLVRVSQAYFDVLSAQDTLTFAKAEYAAIGRQLEQAKQRFDVGLIAITAVHEAQAAFDNALADEIQAENGVDNAWEALREIIGQTPGTLTPLAVRIPLNGPEPADMEQWNESAQRQNPGLLSLRSTAEVAQQNIEVQRSGHYPTLDLVGSHSLNRTDASGSADTDNSSIGLQLSVPLYTGGAVNSLTRQAGFDYQAALESLDLQRRTVSRQVREAYRGVLSSISRVKALEAATLSAKSALEATEAGFEVGTRTMVDVLDEQQNLYRAQRDYARARYDYILNGLLLKQAAGTLSRADLALVNGWLE